MTSPQGEIDAYRDGDYLRRNPTWHVEDSPWKARQIAEIVRANGLRPRTVADVGCGAGAVLAHLARLLPEATELHGYEVSPQAFALSASRRTDRVSFHLADMLSENTGLFDLVIATDVFEHVEDYIGFLKRLRRKGVHTVFHIPLDLSAYSVVRTSALLSNREALGHLHYFTRETALATLGDTGYRIIDTRVTTPLLIAPARGPRARVRAAVFRALDVVSRTAAMRLIPGYSLLVLAG